jgi:hypothetical protein
LSTQAPVGARQEIWMTVIRTGKEFIYVCTQTLMNVIYSWSTCNSKLFSLFSSFVQIKTHTHTHTYTYSIQEKKILSSFHSLFISLSIVCVYVYMCMWWWEANMNKKTMDKQWFKVLLTIAEDLHNDRVWWNMKNTSDQSFFYIFI